jgi:tetratricopeptide (TPR) repeat protein
MTHTRENADPVTGTPGTLASWKEIADYFRCNVRTARRWERDRRLPVYRAPGNKGCTVFAYASELEAWLKARSEEQGPHPAASTSRTVPDPGNIAQNNSRSAEVTEPSATSSDEHLVKQSSLLRLRPWVFAASVLLICSAALFWKAGNHQTAAATTRSQLDALKVTPHVPAPGAEDLFLRGRYFWNLRTADGLTKAIDAYTEAIVLDPSFAEAYAGLAEAYDLLPQFGQADLGDSLKKAELAANRAIALNPNLAAAHRAKAFAMFYWDWDIHGSDAEFRLALALDPNSADAHQWYAGTLQCRDEGAEAMRQIDEAIQLRPTSAAIAADAAYFHADFGDFDAGVRALKEIERTQPALSTPAWFLRDLDFATGNYPDYIAEARRYASITRAPDAVELAGAIARGWTRAGKTGLLEAQARVLKAAFDRGSDTSFQLGETLLLLGYPKEALPYFEASLDRHSILLITMQDCPWAKGLSHDPGYAALFAQVGQRLHGTFPGHLAVVPVSRRLPLLPAHLL